MYKIFIVEDEKSLNDILCFYLENEGFECSSFTNGLDAVSKISDLPHLWVLDIMLPDIDGFILLKKIKEYNPNTPVIFISARDQDLDKIAGLQLGGEDYISKPFMPMELVIRTKKILDRVYARSEVDSLKRELSANYLMDIDKRKVFFKDVEILLTSKEFDALELLSRNEGIAFSRESVLNNVYGDASFISDRSVDDLIRRLRKKLPGINIDTIYGFGYRWCKCED